MAIRDKLLTLFENNRGRYFSGEELASELSVSRTAVWKAVNVLRNEGYEIDAVTNRGYCLLEKNDILSVQGIKKYINSSCAGLNIDVVSSVDSTNIRVRELAERGEAEGCVIIANEQTEGKGRYGRKFYSPDGTGIYMSLLLRPDDCIASDAADITTIAAVAACRAIGSVSSEKPVIKWVNDIYLNGRKICGILTEGAFGLENGILEYAVLGVGLNIYCPDKGFPDDIAEKAGYIFDDVRSDMKNRIAAGFLNNFMELYGSADKSIYKNEYRKYSMVIGKHITVLAGGVKRGAEVLDIDDRCRLDVRYENGEKSKISYGEIEIEF